MSHSVHDKESQEFDASNPHSVRSAQVVEFRDARDVPPSDEQTFCDGIDDHLATSIYMSDYSMGGVNCVRFDYVSYDREGCDLTGRCDRNMLRRRMSEGGGTLQVEYIATGQYRPADRVDDDKMRREFGGRIEISINRDGGDRLKRKLEERQITAVEGSTVVAFEMEVPVPGPILTPPSPAVNSNSDFASSAAGRAVIIACGVIALLLAALLFYKGMQRYDEKSQEIKSMSADEAVERLRDEYRRRNTRGGSSEGSSIDPSRAQESTEEPHNEQLGRATSDDSRSRLRREHRSRRRVTPEHIVDPTEGLSEGSDQTQRKRDNSQSRGRPEQLKQGKANATALHDSNRTSRMASIEENIQRKSSELNRSHKRFNELRTSNRPATFEERIQKKSAQMSDATTHRRELRASKRMSRLASFEERLQRKSLRNMSNSSQGRSRSQSRTASRKNVIRQTSSPQDGKDKEHSRQEASQRDSQGPFRSASNDLGTTLRRKRAEKGKHHKSLTLDHHESQIRSKIERGTCLQRSKSAVANATKHHSRSSTIERFDALMQSKIEGGKSSRGSEGKAPQRNNESKQGKDGKSDKNSESARASFEQRFKQKAAEGSSPRSRSMSQSVKAPGRKQSPRLFTSVTTATGIGVSLL
ncbi:hypothetical protein ACHAWF_016704 [Thalassiosira exigua]